jgi:hypothetical protein
VGIKTICKTIRKQKGFINPPFAATSVPTTGPLYVG